MKLTAFITLAAIATASNASPLPSIGIQGTTYQSACTTSLWKQIQAQLENAASGRNSNGLSALVRTWFCESGPQADEIVRRNVPAKIPLTSEQTGIAGADKSFLTRASVTAMGGNVWDVSVRSEGGKVTVSYSPNEACVASGTFAFRKGQWLLIAKGEACD